MRLCVGSLKGGVGKTTSAVRLARSGRTLLVDAESSIGVLMVGRLTSSA